MVNDASKDGPYGLHQATKDDIAQQFEDEESRLWVSWLLNHTLLYFVKILHPHTLPSQPVAMCSACHVATIYSIFLAVSL